MAAGILEDSGPGSTQSSSCPGNTSSSSSLPPPPPRRFLLRPPAGLLRPAPSAPRVRPARGPASLGSPHPGAWLHEAGGEGRAREVPSTPAASGPGEKVGNSGCAAPSSSSFPAGPGLPRASAALPAGPPYPEASGGARDGVPGVRGQGPGAAWGEGLPGGGVSGRAGGACGPRVRAGGSGVGRQCW